MKRLIFILLFFCALKIYAQGIGGEIKHSSNTYKSTMTSVIRQKIVYKQMKGKELNQTPIEDDSYSVELEKKAKCGNAAAQYALAKIYCFGNGIKANDDLSKHYLLKSAEQGYAAAQYSLGIMYLNGSIDGQTQYELAHKYFVLAAEKGNINAMFYTGVDFLLGRGVTQDTSKALYYIENAAQENDVSALNLLGSMYRDGKYKQKDLHKAFNCFVKSANQGNANAQS